nr:DUF3048 domain-containing protein [Bacillus sp. B15-48]
MFLVGCRNEEEVTKVEPPVGSGDNPVSEEEVPFKFPLTGIETDMEPNDRSVAVIINNHPQARPQSGLLQADLVYEILAEGNVTRFLAIYASEKPEVVGPVRSARDYYIDIAKGYDSLFIAHGYSPIAKQMLDSGYIDHLNGIQYDGTLFKRASFRVAPHNSYITFENIKKGAESKNYNLNQVPPSLLFLDKEEIEVLPGVEAGAVMVSYGNSSFDVQYIFSHADFKYQRSSAGAVTVDFETEDAILLDNILIVEAEHKVLDHAGRREIDIVSGGRGYLLQQGKLNEVEWKNVDGRISAFSNENEVKLVPGKTWINIVPSLEQVSMLD